MTVKAMQAVADQLDAARLGYDQSQRWSFLDTKGRRVIAGRETDCSASCGAIAWLAGYPVDLSGTFYTGNFAQKLKAAGFEVLRFERLSQVRAGDFVLTPGHHVVFARTASRWWSANGDERGRQAGGKAGNQTGRETGYRAAYLRPGGWRYIVRPVPLDVFKGRALAAMANDKPGAIADAVAMLCKRAAFDGPRWRAFLSAWATLNAGALLLFDPAKVAPSTDRHAFVVLGSALTKAGELTPKYLRRLKLAAAGLAANPGSLVIVSGGKPERGTTEAEEGLEWLAANGVDPSRILLEEESASTVGNAANCLPIMRRHGVTSYTLVSDASHLRRALVLFHAAQLRIETRENVRLPIAALPPLAVDDYAPKPVATAAPVEPATRREIAAEVATLLGLRKSFDAAL